VRLLGIVATAVAIAGCGGSPSAPEDIESVVSNSGRPCCTTSNAMGLDNIILGR
jgi:hypothetical protein